MNHVVILVGGFRTEKLHEPLARFLTSLDIRHFGTLAGSVGIGIEASRTLRAVLLVDLLLP